MIAESPTSPPSERSGPGSAHADPGHPVGAHPDLAEQPLDQPARELDPLVRLVIDVERRLRLAQHLVAEVGDRHAHVRVPEVDPDRHARGAGEPQLAGASSSQPSSRSSRASEEIVAGDSPLARASSRLGHRTARAQQPHDGLAVGDPQAAG